MLIRGDLMIGCNTFKQFNRRDFLRIGGATLCGVNLLDILASQARPTERTPRATKMICVWMAGGPPHTDMFDMKPDSPVDYRGEFRPIRSNLPGLDVCELMPRLAQQPLRHDDESPRRSLAGADVLSQRQPAPADRHAAVSDVRQRRQPVAAGARRSANIHGAWQDRSPHQ